MKVALTALALGALSGAGCSQPTDTQPYANACEPLRVQSWSLPAGALDVPRDTTVRLVFDDYPDPDTVGLGGVIVTTGVYYNGGTYGVDLIEKAVTFHPIGSFRPQLSFNITVRPGLRSLHGCEAAMAQRSFRTGTAFTSPTPTPPEARPLADVLPIFAQSCSGGACHRAVGGAPGDGCLAAPAAGLSLCDAQARDALVHVPSRQVSQLDLVKPNDSARSYLLRKLLPGDTSQQPAPGTLGHRDPPGAPLTNDELHVIARWIDTGANP
jgi:hypothetical protein